MGRKDDEDVIRGGFEDGDVEGRRRRGKQKREDMVSKGVKSPGYQRCRRYRESKPL